QTDLIAFTLDGREVEALPGETIWQTARRYGVDIPHLCYKEDQVGLRADGNCRACMVEIEGERVLAPSCCRAPAADMKVSSQNERARHAQKMVLELLEGDTTDTAYIHNSRLGYWSGRLG